MHTTYQVHKNEFWTGLDTIYSLRDHQKIHTALPHACTECHVSFASEEELRDHVKNHGAFSCQACSQKFNSWEKLIRHKRNVHLDKRPFACQECGKTFASQYEYKAHLRVHAKELPYSCPKCDKSFASSNLLTSHMRHAHTPPEKRPYECPLCEERFNFESDLKDHLGTHTRERPFVCPVCNRGYKTVEYLKRHIMSHFPIRIEELSCTMCSKSFTTKTNLKRHLIRAHPELLKITIPEIPNTNSKDHSLDHQETPKAIKGRYICQTCSRSFATKREYRTHVCLQW